MSSQSADTLFHFTSSPENLLGILENEFHPRYCLERCHIGNEIIEVAYPVVCFCDIPLSQIGAHIKTYGHYGIGLSKRWAELHGLNPVLYMKPDSQVGHHLSAVGNTFAERYNEQLAAGATELLHLIGYIKPYSGDFTRRNQFLTNVRFYDEREWRLVFRAERNFLTKDQFLDPIQRARADQVIQADRLSFEPSDIKYVIVDQDTEILSTVRALREIKSPKYSPDVIDILTSRIITCEQATSDF